MQQYCKQKQFCKKKRKKEPKICGKPLPSLFLFLISCCPGVQQAIHNNTVAGRIFHDAVPPEKCLENCFGHSGSHIYVQHFRCRDEI